MIVQDLKQCTAHVAWKFENDLFHVFQSVCALLAGHPKQMPGPKLSPVIEVVGVVYCNTTQRMLQSDNEFSVEIQLLYELKTITSG